MSARRTLSFLLPLALLAAPAALPAQEGRAGEIARLEQALAALRATPGLSLEVNGELVPYEAWQRSLVYLKGNKILEEQILLYIIDERIEELARQEIHRRKVEKVEPQVEKRLAEEEKAFQAANPGKSWDEHLNEQETSRADRRLALQEELVAQCTLENEEALLKEARRKWRQVAEEQVESRIQETIKNFKQKKPDEEFWDFMKRNGYDKEDYRQVVRSTLLFQKLFFGGKPWDWPAITKEAIYNKAGDQGKQFFDGIVKQMRDNPKSEVPPLFMGIFQKWCLESFKEWADIRYASDGLEPQAVLSYNGRTFPTAEAYARVKADISPLEKRRAVRQIVLSTALRQALEKEGCLPDAEEFAQAWEEHCKPYEGSPFNIQVIAMQFKGYPSMEVYRERFRLMHGYKKLMEKKGLYAEKHLKEFVPEVKAFLGESAVDVELIRFTARDEKAGEWLPAGHAAAKAQAEMVMEALEQGAMTFAEAKKLSRWSPDAQHGGVFTNKTRNELRKELGEAEHTDFLSGYSVADLVFEKAPEGKVIGPLCGLDGYYIARVLKRHPPRKPVSLDDPNMREMILQEYLVRRFLEWANEVAAGTRVE